MKVKLDFASNSSSTSFVYICNEDLQRDDFFRASGVSPKSPVASLFNQMYDDLSSRINGGTELCSDDDIDSFYHRYEFTEETIAKMKTALSKGQKVIVSQLSSENNLPEMMMCTSIFEIESDKFQINAYSNYW